MPGWPPKDGCQQNVVWVQTTKTFQRLNTARKATSWMEETEPGKSEGGEVCVVNLNPWINLLETSSAFPARQQLTQKKKKKKAFT